MEEDKTPVQGAQELFSTRELALAAALQSLKFLVVNIDYQYEADKERPIGYFKFAATKELKEAIAQYRAGKMLVDPRSFMFSYHELKSQTTGFYKSPSGLKSNI